MSLQVLQDRAVEKMGEKNPNSAFDPTIILVIAEMVADLIATLQDRCRQSAHSATRIVRSPSWLQRRYLRRSIYFRLGRRGYRQYGRDVYYSLLETGQTVTASEMEGAYEESE